MFETETVRPCLVQKFKCGTMCEGSNFCRIENFNLKWAEFDFLKVADFVHFRVKFYIYIYILGLVLKKFENVLNVRN